MSLPSGFTASALGLMEEADPTKRRIHHLSYSPDDSTAINNGMPEEYGAIVYSTIDDAVKAIHHFGSRYKAAILTIWPHRVQEINTKS